MPIVKRDCVIEDSWRPLGGRDLTELDTWEHVLLSLAEWRELGRAAAARFERIGIALAPDEAVDDIVDALGDLDLVALAFPKFNDGRAFSQARLLRERHGFHGEIRATGHVIRDLYLFLQRSGFDAVAVADARELNAWLAARRRFTGFYQPALDDSDEDAVPVAALRQRDPVERVAADDESVAALWAY